MTGIDFSRLERVHLDHVATTDAVERAWAAHELSDHDRAYGKKQATKEGKARLFAEAQGVAAQLRTRFYSTDRDAGDRYAASFWDPATLNTEQINLHSELISRKLSRAQDPSYAAEVIAEAMAGPREATYALWRSGPAALKGSHDVRISMMSERCERSLDNRLKQDAGYQEAVQRQNQLFQETQSDIRHAGALLATELGGYSRFSDTPLAGLHPADAAATILDNFRVESSALDANMNRVDIVPKVSYRVDPRRPDGETRVIVRHDPSDGSTGGLI